MDTAFKNWREDHENVRSILAHRLQAPIINDVKAMQLMKQHVGVGAMKVYATNVVYYRIIGLQASNSTLKRQLHAEPSNRHTDQDNSLNIGGSAMLRLIPWPTNGKVQDCVDKAVTLAIRKVK